MILAILLFISVILNVGLLFASFNLIRKVEVFEDFNSDLQTQLLIVLDQIKSVDLRGAFEHDDEVGLAFTGIKHMIYTLGNFASYDRSTDEAPQ